MTTDVTQPKRDLGTAAPETGRLGESESPRLKASSSQSLPTLRLWLPGYHTPSLNVTKGVHWSVYRRHKLEAAREVLKALVASSPVYALARRILLLLSQGGTKAAVRKLRGPATPQTVTGLTRLTYTRVTCQPLDAENHVGSTKGLTDCLVSAFPGWLPDDAPEYVEILHKQERCRTQDEEGTWIELRLDQEGPARSATLSVAGGRNQNDEFLKL